jgi:hypothetical protein
VALTYEKYQKLQALLSDPNKEFPDDERERAQAAVDGYKNEFLAKGAASGEKPLAEGEDERVLSVGQAVRPGTHPDQAKVAQLVSSLDPGISLPAQALATQPGTTHRDGDEAAKDEWLRGPLDNPAGRVIYYEPPVREVRQALLEKPELFRALQMSVPSTPEEVMAIQPGDATVQAYGDYQWKQTAEAAAKGGKTAYRYSKAPYLGEGPNAPLLSSLKTKLQASGLPAIEGITAIIGGIDDTASVGLGAAAAPLSELDDDGPPKLTPEEEASGKYGWHPTLGKVPKEWEKKTAAGGKPIGGGNDEVVGGLASSVNEGNSVREALDSAEEEHPNLHTAGQVGGAFMPSHWNPATGLWDWVVGQGASKGLARGAASGAARGAAAGGVEQTAREGVQAASSYAETGDAGTSLGDAGGRVLGAAAATALPSGLGGGLRGLGNKVVDEVRWGDAYKGAPGRVEAQGIEPKMFKGHEAPEVVKEAELRGRKEGGKRPLQVLAKDLDEPLADAANYRLSDVERVGEGNAAEHYASPEGKHTLPVRNLVETSMVKLRKLTSEVSTGVKGVGRARAENPVKDVFNANIENVSTRKTKVGVPMSAKEARAFLSPEWQEKLDLDKLEKRKATVYVTPRRYDSQGADEAIEQLGKSTDDDVADLYEAALMDRQERSWNGRKGGWSEVQEEQARAHDKASDTTRRLGSAKPGGVRRAVTRMGRSRGQSEDIEALEETARRAGGGAVTEKLRGARVAEDLGDLKSWASVGGKSPRGDGKRSLLGLTALGDMAMLRGVYPAARKLETAKPGAAAKASRAGAVAVRNNMDSPADERREKRDEKGSDGYRERAKDAGAGGRQRHKQRKLIRRRRVASSEAQQ